MADFSKTSRKPHAETEKDPRFNVSPLFSSNDSNLYQIMFTIRYKPTLYEFIYI
jgi:hypothetical protein